MTAAPAEPSPHILAIDMGTGTAKAALVSRRGRIAAAAMREIEMLHLPGGGAEQDPEQWWEAVVGAAREAIERSGLAPEQVIAVRCATQWAVTVPVDAEGRALANAVSWMDTRGGPHVRRLVRGPLKVAGYSVAKLPRWLRLTGGAPVLSGIDGLGHLLYFKHERPDIYAAAAAFLEPMDYLNLRLCGRAAASYASIYPYWLTDNRDVSRVRYDARLLRRAGIDPAKLPELAPLDAVLGTLAPAACEALGLGPGTRVLSGLPDGQAATIGAGIVAEGEGYVSIGTSSWLSCLVPRKKTDLRHMIATAPAALPGRHQVIAEQGAAGRCLEFVARNVLYGDDASGPAPPPDLYELLDREAASVPPGSDGLLFTPWLNGVNAPREDPYTRSAFFNQSLATTRAHYVRATMEGVAYNLRWLKGAVERFAGRRFERLNLIGGAALSGTWCQVLADVLDCEIGQVANPRYANAVGAALSGFAALGELDPAEIPAAVELSATYEPNAAARRVHERQFEHFLGLYRANRRLYRRLNNA
ncbi:MAG TPA: FGGY-family carbohydrate kinase [Solirubrobacterales bacterium]|nr:FGGY-family carbohydrate kinase [Solirubrobacterales bacterium]